MQWQAQASAFYSLDYISSDFSYRVIKTAFRFLVRFILPLIARIEIRGAENLLIEGGGIITANHLGQLDAAMIFFLLDRNDVMYLVNDKYQNHPLFGRGITSLGGIYIKRDSPNLKAIRTALRHTKNGGILVITPEAYRSTTGTLQHGRAGVTFLAYKLKKPIVPVAITGTQDERILKNIGRLCRSPITITVGKSFELPPMAGTAPAIENATDEIMCQIAALLPENYRGVYANHPRLEVLLRKRSFN